MSTRTGKQPQFTNPTLIAIQRMLTEDSTANQSLITKFKNLSQRLETPELNEATYRSELWTFIGTHLIQDSNYTPGLVEERLMELSVSSHFKGSRLAVFRIQTTLTFGYVLWNALSYEQADSNTNSQTPVYQEKNKISRLFQELLNDSGLFNETRRILTTAVDKPQMTSQLEQFFRTQIGLDDPAVTEAAQQMADMKVDRHAYLIDEGLEALYEALW
ncbi:MAG: hypothetical protein NXI24_18290 [bacterium]|nr:hypothetical protein [bacterium]